MSKVWLVAVDGSEGSGSAVRYAASHADDAGARIVLAHVIAWSQYEFLTPQELSERHAQKEMEIKRAKERILIPLATEVSEQGIEVTSIVKHGQPAKVLCKLAASHEASHVFIGKKGHNRLSEVLFGSVASNLIQICPVPVTVVP